MEKRSCYYQNKVQGIEIVHLQDSSLAYPMHNHASIYSFIIVMTGEIEVTVGKQKKSYTRGDIIVILPYEVHEIIPMTKTYSMLTFCIRKTLIVDQNADLLGMIGQCLKEIEEQLLPAEFKEKLFDAIGKERKIERCFDVHLEMAKLRAYIEEHSKEELDLDELSSILHISKYHMIRLFREYVGLTPHKYQLQNRIRLAQRLIEEDEPLMEVAMETGFYDQSHFIKQFKKIVGVTPHEYSGLYKKI